MKNRHALYTLYSLGGFLIITDVLASAYVWLSVKSKQVPAKKLFFLNYAPGRLSSHLR